MNRREFIKGAVATAATLSFGTGIEVLLPPSTSDTTIAGDWVIDFTTKNITYVGSKNKAITTLELHRSLSEVLEKSDNMMYEIATNRHTDQHISLVNGYSIDEESINHLCDGFI